MSAKVQSSGVVEPGQLVGGKYRIDRLLGSGAMGAVYAAEHEQLGSPAALKFLLPSLARMPVLAERFLREGRISATLKSPHVLQVTDVDQLPSGLPYLVMELLEGQSLQGRLDSGESLSSEEILDISLQILMGLEVAHESGIVHRDLKPDNIFLSKRGENLLVQILDFGIAKVRASTEFQSLTRPGSIMGTPEYMAPEQTLSADKAEPRSDLYAVGVMLYEMFSGELPVTGMTAQEIMQKIREGNIVPLANYCPNLPISLIHVVEQAMSQLPQDRPDSAKALRLLLADHAGRLSFSGSLAAGRSIEPPPSDPSSPPAARVLQATANMPLPGQKAPVAATINMPPAYSSPAPPPRKKRVVRFLAVMLVVAGLLGALTVGYLRWSQQRFGPPPPMPIPKHLQSTSHK